MSVLVAGSTANLAPSRTGEFLKSLAYVGFEVSDLAAWTTFARDVLGLTVLRQASTDLLLKMDARPYRIILTSGVTDDISFAGWEVEDEAALDAYASYLQSLGVPFAWASADDAAARHVSRMLRVEDPNGVIHEAHVAMADDVPFAPGANKGAFVTGPGGLGHIVFGSNDYAGSVAFARDVLGAGLSDTIEQVITPTVSAHVTFMHVNERHHSIAFAGRAGGKKLHHFMIEVERIDDVGRARDRHLKTGLAIVQDIGQHPNDQMISYYGATPSGFFVEFGWGGVKVDVENWEAGAYDRMSDWGHRPVGAPIRPAPKTSEEKKTVTATGTWNLKLTTPMGEQPAVLVLSDDVSGTLTAMGETVAAYDGALDGDVLSFKADATSPFPVKLEFKLTLADTDLTGSVQVGPMGEAPVTGTRA